MSIFGKNCVYYIQIFTVTSGSVSGKLKPSSYSPLHQQQQIKLFSIISYQLTAVL